MEGRGGGHCIGLPYKIGREGKGSRPLPPSPLATDIVIRDEAHHAFKTAGAVHSSCLADMSTVAVGSTIGTSVGSTIGTAVGVSVSVTFVVSFSLGVLVASVLCYISRRSTGTSSHADPATVYEEVGTNKKIKGDVMEMDTNAAYGSHSS